MVEPAAFVELPEANTMDFEALPQITKNNQACVVTRTRYIELQRWIRGRSQ